MPQVDIRTSSERQAVIDRAAAIQGVSRAEFMVRVTATGDDSDRLHVEFGRLLCDDGHSASHWDGAGKTQGSQGVDGWAASRSGCCIAYEAIRSPRLGGKVSELIFRAAEAYGNDRQRRLQELDGPKI